MLLLLFTALLDVISVVADQVIAPDLGVAAAYTMAAGTISFERDVSVVGNVAYSTRLGDGILTQSGTLNIVAIDDEIYHAFTLAYEYGLGLPSSNDIFLPTNQDPTQEFTPGVYKKADSGSMPTNTEITFNGPGVYIFTADETFTVDEDWQFHFINGATQNDVFWIVAGSIYVEHSNFPGTIIAGEIWMGQRHQRAYAGYQIRFGTEKFANYIVTGLPTTIPNLGILSSYSMGTDTIYADDVTVVVEDGDFFYTNHIGERSLISPWFMFPNRKLPTPVGIADVFTTLFQDVASRVPSSTVFIPRIDMSIILAPGVYTDELNEPIDLHAHITFDGFGVFIMKFTDQLRIQTSATFTFINGAVPANVYWFATTIRIMHFNVPGTLIAHDIFAGPHSDRMYASNSITFESNVEFISVSNVITSFNPLVLPVVNAHKTAHLIARYIELYDEIQVTDFYYAYMGISQPHRLTYGPTNGTITMVALLDAIDNMNFYISSTTIFMSSSTNPTTIVPGIYTWLDACDLNGSVTFSGVGIFIMQCTTKIRISTKVLFIFQDGALPENVLWSSSAEIIASAPYIPGTVLAPTITVTSQTHKLGRVFAANRLVIEPGRDVDLPLRVLGPTTLPDPPPDGPFDCPTVYGADLTACTADDDRCHVDQIGPVATCVNGPPVSKDILFYEMPVQIVSVTTGAAPHVFEVVVRVPIFQAYDTSGYFQFLVGTASKTINMSSITPSPTCNTMASHLTLGAWPQSYSALRDQPTCGWANVDTAMANEALRLERDTLKAWVNRNGVFPWQAPTDGGAAYDVVKANCWRSILGDINMTKTASDSVAMTGGLISNVAIPGDPNFIQYTLHVNADMVWGTCHPTYPGLTYAGVHVGTDSESIKYTIPITAVQRTSNRKQIVTIIYTSLQVMTTVGNATVSTSIYQPVSINEIGVEVESLDMISVGPLDPDTSMASAHRLEMTFLLTVEKPDDTNIVSLGPLNPETDIVLNIPGKSANCYGDSFKHAPTTFEPILPCLVDANEKTQCQFRIHLLSDARTDVYDGSSFATCAGTIGAKPHILDKLHIFGVKLQLCTWDGCSYVSADPIRVVSSFSIPVFPLRSATQNEQIYALMLPTAETSIITLDDALANYGARRLITSTDTINVAIVTRPALWERYSLSILSNGNAIQLFHANTGVLINDATGWTLVANQTKLVGDMRFSPKWRVATGLDASPIPGYPACEVVGMGCDGFSFDASKIMAHTNGPQVKFVTRVNIAMQTYNPVSRRIFSTIDVDKTLGAWSTNMTRRVVPIDFAAWYDSPLTMSGRRRHNAVPDTQTSSTNEPFMGTVGSTFVLARPFLDVNGTAYIDDETDSNDNDVFIGVMGALAGLCLCVAIGIAVYYRRRNVTAVVALAPANERQKHVHATEFGSVKGRPIADAVTYKQFSFNDDRNMPLDFTL